ncbi:MAG: hypothetical protein JNL17_12650 [Cyclobacteriaceae bacterium]|nr:hypothetical protein [Cyclobacteriaceae bacterium]
MEQRDLIVTPIVIFLVLAGAYAVRPRFTDEVTRKYFFPALLVKIFGALALGFIYQYYYSGGDTYNFHTHGSRHIWEAFWDDPTKGFKLLFGSADPAAGVYKYSSRIIFFNDPNSYFVVRVAAFFDLITFSAYSATAVFFATVGFAGGWLLFQTFYQQYPQSHRGLALACLFIPSVFFWGSGVLKDTLVLAALGVSTFCFYKIVLNREPTLSNFVFLLLSLFVVYSIKKFVLQAYLPALVILLFGTRISQFRSTAAKILLIPGVIMVTFFSGYYAVVKIGEGDNRYAIDRLALTAQTTAYDIRYWTGRDAGSGYTLGELDGSFESMIRLAPAAINVTLFRPYLWEVKNPLMLLSSLESLALMLFSLYLLVRVNIWLPRYLGNIHLLFCLVFSLSFAFAVGVSTFNFGTLSRYKIPMLPFFMIALVLILDHANRLRKFRSLANTE